MNERGIHKFMSGFFGPILSLKVILRFGRMLMIIGLSALLLYPRGIFTVDKLVKMIGLIFLDLTLAHCLIDVFEGKRCRLWRAIQAAAQQWRGACAIFTGYFLVEFLLFHYEPIAALKRGLMSDGLVDHILPIMALAVTIITATAGRKKAISLSQGLENLKKARLDFAGFALACASLGLLVWYFFPLIAQLHLEADTTYMAAVIAIAVVHRALILCFCLKLYCAASWRCCQDRALMPATEASYVTTTQVRPRRAKAKARKAPKRASAAKRAAKPKQEKAKKSRTASSRSRSA